MLFNFGTSKFGECNIDLFASEKPNYLQVCFTRWKGWWYSYAFSMSWNSEEQAWIKPPVSLIDKVVNKIVVDKARALVVTPYLGQKPWFERLLRLCHEQPVAVDIQSNLYVPRSLANFQDMQRTPWRWMLMWPVSARQDAYRVVVNSNVTTWERYMLGSHGIVPSKKLLKVLIDKCFTSE